MATKPVTPDALIAKLQPADLAQLEDLLRNNHLPTEDCAGQLPAFFGIFELGKLIAAGGLEFAGDCALLRSIVVQREHRAQGLARALIEFLISTAENRGVLAVYLLTETADSYFANFGFVPVDRTQAPAPITRTSQFDSLCPESATFMELRLQAR